MTQRPTDSDLPVHAVANNPLTSHHVARLPGRPRQIRPAPSADERRWDAGRRAARTAHVEADPIVCATQTGATTLDQVISATAREAAALGFEADAARLGGRDAERVRARRVRALAGLSRLVLQRHALEVNGQTIPGDQLLAVSKLWSALVQQAAEVLPEPEREALLSRFGTAMGRWRREAGVDQSARG